MAHKTYQNLIGGQWVPSRTGKTFLNINPARHDDVVGEFQASAAEDVDAAVAAAAEAFKTWRLTPAPKRAEILYRAGQILVERKEQYARDMTREMGKVLAETRGDVQEAIDTAFYMAGEGRRLFGHTTPSELRNKFAMSRPHAGRRLRHDRAVELPHGHPLVEALARAGLRQHLRHQARRTTRRSRPATWSRRWSMPAFPPGVVNVVTGSGSQVGTPHRRAPRRQRHLLHRIVRSRPHRRPDRRGPLQALLARDGRQERHDRPRRRQPRPRPRRRALGSLRHHRPALHRDQPHHRAPRRSRRSSPTELVDRAEELKVGDGLDESVQMGPQVNRQQIETSIRYCEIAKKEGAKLLTGGKPLTKGAFAKGHFFAPTVFAKVKPGMRIAQEEVFGPVVSVLECTSFDEAIAISNGIQYGLSTALYTRDVNRAFRAMRDLEAGITYINAPTIGAEVHLPFGGVKQTGNGHREGGIGALDFYTTWKSVYVDYSDKLQRAQIDTGE